MFNLFKRNKDTYELTPAIRAADFAAHYDPARDLFSNLSMAKRSSYTVAMHYIMDKHSTITLTHPAGYAAVYEITNPIPVPYKKMIITLPQIASARDHDANAVVQRGRFEITNNHRLLDAQFSAFPIAAAAAPDATKKTRKMLRAANAEFFALLDMAAARHQNLIPAIDYSANLRKIAETCERHASR